MKNQNFGGRKLIALLLACLMMLAVTGCKEETAKEPDPFAAYEVGDIICFGSYEQDGNMSNGKEDLAWRVMEKQEGKLLLLSEYGVSKQTYHHKQEPVTWEHSNLRYWLNDSFYYSAFGEAEQARILSETVSADFHPKYSSDAGHDTQDKVFIPGLSDYTRFYSDPSEGICPATAQAKNEGAFEENGGCWYWLRTPGETEDLAVSVNSDGQLDHATRVNGINGCVRPMLWISFEP